MVSGSSTPVAWSDTRYAISSGVMRTTIAWAMRESSVQYVADVGAGRPSRGKGAAPLNRVQTNRAKEREHRLASRHVAAMDDKYVLLIRRGHGASILARGDTSRRVAWRVLHPNFAALAPSVGRGTIRISPRVANAEPNRLTPASPRRLGAICSRTKGVPKPYRQRSDSLPCRRNGSIQLIVPAGRRGIG